MAGASDFEGMSALVTGGASGIGAAVATLLLERGARVAVLDRETAGAPESLSGDLRSESGRGLVRAIPRRWKVLVAELLGHFGNAGSVRARAWPPDQRSPDRL